MAVRLEGQPTKTGKTKGLLMQGDRARSAPPRRQKAGRPQRKGKRKERREGKGRKRSRGREGRGKEKAKKPKEKTNERIRRSSRPTGRNQSTGPLRSSAWGSKAEWLGNSATGRQPQRAHFMMAAREELRDTCRQSRRAGRFRPGCVRCVFSPAPGRHWRCRGRTPWPRRARRFRETRPPPVR